MPQKAQLGAALLLEEHPALPAVFAPSLWLCPAAPALLPCSPGAEQHCQGDKGLRLGAAIPCSCGLAENYCSAGEENNILFTVSPGTRLRAEQVLTHRLRRGAEMQSPAVSCELSLALAQPHTSTCTCTGTSTSTSRPSHGPMDQNGPFCLQPPQAVCAVPPQPAGVGLAQPTPSKSRGVWPGVAGTGKGPSHPTELPREPGVLKKDPASPFHFPAENIWSAWHLCCSKYSRASCSRARCHRDRWVRAQAAKRPCISIKCVC